MPGMSPAALKRCRTMTITADREDGTSKTLRVFDPKRGDKEVAKYTTRSPQDEMRVKRAWMAKFKVPEENITVVEFAAHGA